MNNGDGLLLTTGSDLTCGSRSSCNPERLNVRFPPNSTKHATLLAFQGVQGRRRTPATQRAALLPRFLGTPVWHARSRRSPDHSQPCRMKRAQVSEARESTLAQTLTATNNEWRSALLASLHPHNKNKGRYRRLQQLQAGDRWPCIRRTATAEEFRGHGCALRRAPWICRHISVGLPPEHHILRSP
jgi:hypothetical protein